MVIRGDSKNSGEGRGSGDEIGQSQSAGFIQGGSSDNDQSLSEWGGIGPYLHQDEDASMEGSENNNNNHFSEWDGINYSPSRPLSLLSDDNGQSPHHPTALSMSTSLSHISMSDDSAAPY